MLYLIAARMNKESQLIFANLLQRLNIVAANIGVC